MNQQRYIGCAGCGMGSWFDDETAGLRDELSAEEKRIAAGAAAGQTVPRSSGATPPAPGVTQPTSWGTYAMIGVAVLFLLVPKKRR